ncbi:MAG TPA: hypothetical protein VFH97_09180 [Gemmatimonadales bacterium]|nr:hypothetical protein [Gemmatimonadales bacterium]
MLRSARLPMVLALSAVLWACSDNGPGDEIVFPTIDADILLEFCIRGEVPVTATTSRSGSVSTSDCTAGFDDGYWEGWRVRVAEAGSYTIEVSSDFDSWLTVWRLNDVNNVDDATVDLLGEDDDSAGNLDAMLTVSLQPNTEYVVFVSGYDQSQVGA